MIASIFQMHGEASGKQSGLGIAIRSLRKEKGLTQEVLAKKSGIDRTTVARLEGGKFKSLSVQKLEGVAAAFGMDLKTLFIRIESESMKSLICLRSSMEQAEFVLNYPDEGFQLVSFTPRRKENFFGKIEIRPQFVLASEKLPHPAQIYIQQLEGKMVLDREGKESLLRPGDHFAFQGAGAYSLYNPDPLKTASALFITCPGFLSEA